MRFPHRLLARRVPITNEKSMPEATNGARAEARPPASSRISPTQISIFLLSSPLSPQCERQSLVSSGTGILSNRVTVFGAA